MATYSGTQNNLITSNQSSSVWSGKWEFTLTPGNTLGSYTYSLNVWLKLPSGYESSNPRTTSNDINTASLKFSIPEIGVSKTLWGAYGPINSSSGWYKFLGTVSGSFTISKNYIVRPMFDLHTGLSNSTGTNYLYAIDTWEKVITTTTLQGTVIAPTISGLSCVTKSSDTIVTSCSINWGNEPSSGIRTIRTDLEDSNGTVIKTVSNNSTTASFTGLSRYTPYYAKVIATNSKGTTTSNRLLIYTKPEIPKLNNVTIISSTLDSITVKPGVVTDNGGKTITSIETYIRGGQYGYQLTPIGGGSNNLTATGLLHNTEYMFLTKATNGETEGWNDYSYGVTLGNPPVITDIYATDITATSAKINFTADYDLNAKLDHYEIRWRYDNSSTWNTLPMSTNVISNLDFSDKDNTFIWYDLRVYDNWGRSTTSNPLTFSIKYSPIVTLNYVKNSNGTIKITGTWPNGFNLKSKSIILASKEEGQQAFEIVGDKSTFTTITNTGFTVTSKAYKNEYTSKSFYLFSSLLEEPIYLEVPGKTRPPAVTLIGSSGRTKTANVYTIAKNRNNETEKKQLRKHDIIKLSKYMRYIDIDSKGTSDIVEIERDNTITYNDLEFKIKSLVRHESGNLYNILVYELKAKLRSTSSLTKLRIRNNGLKLVLNYGIDNQEASFYINNVELNKNDYIDIDCSRMSFYVVATSNNSIATFNYKLGYIRLPEFDLENSVSAPSLYSDTITITNGDSDIVNNHLVHIEVYDDTNTNVASGRTVKLTDGSSALVYNGGNATGNITDSNKFIYSNNGLPLRLDLGREYKISKIVIQRRMLGVNGEIKNKYSRNYIIGRNNNKELCYIFLDSIAMGDLSTEHLRTINVN